MKVAPNPSRILALAAAALAATLLSACSGLRLEGSAWMLSTMGEQSVSVESSLPTLRFASDRVTGSDGCNRFLGTWYRAGSTLRIGRDLAASRRVCGEAVHASADSYSRTLARATAWRIEQDGSLVLLDPRGAALAVFQRQPTGLVDKVWRVTGYADASRAIVGVRPGSLITVEFDTDGRVRGFGGCSPYAGPWAMAERGLNVGPLQSSRAACAGPADLLLQEEAYLRSIGSATAMHREGERLELRNATGAVVATAAAMPRTAPVSRQ